MEKPTFLQKLGCYAAVAGGAVTGATVAGLVGAAKGVVIAAKVVGQGAKVVGKEFSEEWARQHTQQASSLSGVTRQEERVGTDEQVDKAAGSETEAAREGSEGPRSA